MNRRRCGLVAIVSLASALGLAAPATAEPTLSASTQMVRAGQVINVAGNRWETFWAVVCPGALSFVSVSFVQRDEADHLATLSPWEVWPITGAWNYDVRIPAGARPGPAQIVAQQNKTSFDLFRGGCYREGTLSRTVEVNVAGTPIADPPSPPAEIRLYSVTPIAGSNRARPGATLEVTGTGFEVPERCRVRELGSQVQPHRRERHGHPAGRTIPRRRTRPRDRLSRPSADLPTAAGRRPDAGTGGDHRITRGSRHRVHAHRRPGIQDRYECAGSSCQPRKPRLRAAHTHYGDELAHRPLRPNGRALPRRGWRALQARRCHAKRSGRLQRPGEDA